MFTLKPMALVFIFSFEYFGTILAVMDWVPRKRVTQNFCMFCKGFKESVPQNENLWFKIFPWNLHFEGTRHMCYISSSESYFTDESFADHDRFVSVL